MEKKIVGMYFISQVHAGAGGDVGIVDLPIQRERITGYPIIRGVKGAFRHQIELDKNQIREIFGPEDSGEQEAGALSFSEARILLFPVRGIREPFYYVTCPTVLKRFKRDAEKSFNVPDVDNQKALSMNGKDLYLEGIRIGSQKTPEIDEVWNAIKDVIPSEFVEDVKKRFVIVSDELFGYLVKTTTEVVPRIRIDEKTGTVKKGALWYEEYLPMDSVMYVVIRDRGIKRNKIKKLIEEFVKAVDGKTMTLGGKVGVGSGFVRVKVSG